MLLKGFLTQQHQSGELRSEVGGAQKTTLTKLLMNLQVKLIPDREDTIFTPENLIIKSNIV